MTPTMVTETRTVTVTEYHTENRSQKVVRIRCVPVTKQVPCTYTVNETQIQKRTETYIECVPMTKPETQTYTILVPTVEKRTGTRMICQTVPTVVARTCMRDMGHWEERCVEQLVYHSSGHRRHHRHGCGESCECPCVVTTAQRV
jgi:hypothetical protein